MWIQRRGTQNKGVPVLRDPPPNTTDRDERPHVRTASLYGFCWPWSAFSLVLTLPTHSLGPLFSLWDGIEYMDNKIVHICTQTYNKQSSLTVSPLPPSASPSYCMFACKLCLGPFFVRCPKPKPKRPKVLTHSLCCPILPNTPQYYSILPNTPHVVSVESRENPISISTWHGVCVQ